MRSSRNLPLRITSPGRALAWAIRLLVPATALWGLAACATLPAFKPLLEYGDRAPVRLVGARRVLSAERSRAILKRLQEQGTDDILSRHLAFVEEVTGSSLILGNEATLLIDGPATYAAMFRAIAGARDHINLETFTFADDELSRKLADALLEKQSEGVQVNIIYDSLGSLSTPQEFFDRMAERGVNIYQFNPVNPTKGNPLALDHRDHRKILVVDGRIAFTGGVNIQSVYGSSSSVVRLREKPPSMDEGWRDTHIEIRGPAVAAFQRLFLETWQKQKGAPLATRDYFPALSQQGRKIIQVIGSSPDDNQSVIYLTLLSAITNSARSVHLTTAYFVPDRQMLDALIEARRRGVDVTLMLPGISDFMVVLYAGRSHYEDLLEAGVGIYERRDVMLHAKTAVIDGVWSTVGSANMDLWSFLYDDEVNAVVLGEDFGRQMEAMFESDLAVSTRIDPQTWKDRSIGQRLKEFFAWVWEAFL
jgi:cardiolipin synthase